MYVKAFDTSSIAFATATRKTFNALFTEKTIFRLGIFYYHYTDADVGSPKFLHTLFDKYLDRMLAKFEQNRMVRSTKKFRHCLAKRNVNHFLRKCGRHFGRPFCDTNYC